MMWISSEEWTKYYIWSRTFSFNVGITIGLVILVVIIITLVFYYIKEYIKSIKKKRIMEYMESIGYKVETLSVADRKIQYFYKDGLKYYNVDRFCNNNYYDIKIVKERYKKDEDQRFI